MERKMKKVAMFATLAVFAAVFESDAMDDKNNDKNKASTYNTNPKTSGYTDLSRDTNGSNTTTPCKMLSDSLLKIYAFHIMNILNCSTKKATPNDKLMMHTVLQLACECGISGYTLFDVVELFVMFFLDSSGDDSSGDGSSDSSSDSSSSSNSSSMGSHITTITSSIKVLRRYITKFGRLYFPNSHDGALRDLDSYIRPYFSSEDIKSSLEKSYGCTVFSILVKNEQTAKEILDANKLSECKNEEQLFRCLYGYDESSAVEVRLCLGVDKFHYQLYFPVKNENGKLSFHPKNEGSESSFFVGNESSEPSFFAENEVEAHKKIEQLKRSGILECSSYYYHD
jgi:hypothetical protein